MLIHLFFLMGLQNRSIAFVRWTVIFVTHGRGARLITDYGHLAKGSRAEETDTVLKA